MIPYTLYTPIVRRSLDTGVADIHNKGHRTQCFSENDNLSLQCIFILKYRIYRN